MYKKRTLAALISISVLGVIFGVNMLDFDTFTFRACFAVAGGFSVLMAVACSRSYSAKESKRFIAVALAVAAFSFGVLRVSLYNDSAISVKSFDNKYDTVRFEIDEVNVGYLDSRVITSELGLPKGKIVRVYLNEFPKKPVSGDEFLATVRYDADVTSTHYANGISLLASGEMVETFDGDGVFYNIRKSISENSKLLYDGFDDAGAISKAVIVGDRSDLTSYIFTLYKTSGISHVLAISGLHITLVSMSISAILRGLTVHRKYTAFLSALFSLVYAGLVGFTAGAVRSAIMLSIFMAFRMFKREADGVTSIFIALAVLLLINPYSILSKGLQLSFLCSLGIILARSITVKIDAWRFNMRTHTRGYKRKILSMIARMASSLVVSFSATIFSFPVLCFGFDTFSYLSPVMNFFTVWIFTLAVKFAFAAFLIAPISTVIAKIVAYPAGFVFDLVTDISRYFYDADIGNISVHQKFMFVPIVLSFLMVICLVISYRHRLKVFAVVAVSFCLSVVFCTLYNNSVLTNKIITEYGTASSEYVYFQSEECNIYFDLGGYKSESSSIFENGEISLDRYIMLRYNSYSIPRFDSMSSNLKIHEIHLPAPTDAYQVSILNGIKELANERNCDIILHEDDIYFDPSEKLSISVFGNDDDFFEERMITVEVEEKSFVFVGNGFDYAVNSDVAVLMNGYSGDVSKIDSNHIYASDSYIKKRDEVADTVNAFPKRLVIEYKTTERDFVFYES